MITIGDQVYTSKSLDNRYYELGVVTHIGCLEDPNRVFVMSKHGTLYKYNNQTWIKTGKHFNQVEKLFQTLKKDEYIPFPTEGKP